MSFPKFQRTVVDEFGDILEGATVTVRVQQTSLLATIYENRAGTVSKTNPFATGADGLAEFFALNGEYEIEVTSPSGSITWEYVQLGGTAAILDTGTGAGEIPTNSDLPAFGTAALADVGTGTGELPPSENVTLKDSDTGSAFIPSGTTAQRTAGTNPGNFRHNSETDQFEGQKNSGDWGQIGGGSVGPSGKKYAQPNALLWDEDFTFVNTAEQAGYQAAGPIEVADGVNITLEDGVNLVIS